LLHSGILLLEKLGSLQLGLEHVAWFRVVVELLAGLRQVD
jgi:hypothetical protein